MEFCTAGPGSAEQLDDQRRGDREDRQEDDEAQRGHRHAILAQAPPEQLQRRAGGNFTARIEHVESSARTGEYLGGADAHVSLIPSSQSSLVHTHIPAAYKFDVHTWPTC